MVMQAHCFGISTEPWTLFNFPQTSTSSNWVSSCCCWSWHFCCCLPVLSLTGFNWQLQEPDAKLLCLSQQSQGSHSCNASGLNKASDSSRCLDEISGSFPRLFSWADAKSRCCARVRNNWVQVLVLPLITEHIGKVISSVGAWAFFRYDDQNSGVFFWDEMN